MVRTYPITAKQIKAAKEDPRYLAARNAEPHMLWRDEALCRDYDTESFFPSETDDPTLVLRICSVCPVRDHCLADALECADRFGIRGCTTHLERRPMLLAWHEKAGAEPTPDTPVIPPISCGTVVGAEAHYRRKETVCGSCASAVESAGLQVPA
jgi:WhiB family redox-sensing transcriptional regulator